MYISLDWLQDFVKIPKTQDPYDLADTLTLKTAEVESVFDESENLEKIVAGQIIELLPHPNADKLKIAKTSIGKETVPIICGGANLKEGMYVAVALPGAKIRWHGEGDPVTLEKTKIRGEKSYGMICASNEIGLDNPEEGPEDILDLSSIKPNPGTPLTEILEKNDIVFEFDNKSLTHRPDLWGHYGIAREISAIKDYKFITLKPKAKIPSTGESVKVEIKDYDLCPRYCGLIINNIKVEESPSWMKKRLKATGHGTHNNIVDVTNYILTELGQPMHAFDKNYIKGKIIVRRAKKDEKITTLDDKIKKLTEKMLVIADHDKPVAVAGVIGGENSEINNNTTSIILESANFNAASVRRTSSSLGIRTDAVQRFEKSLDPNLAELAIKRAAELILEICPEAKIAGPITDIQKFNKNPLKINLDVQKTKSKIGVDIPAEEIRNILENLNFKIKEKEKNIYEVTVPSFRATKDIENQDDLIEEIARIYGYENVPTSLPTLPTKLPEENTERFKKHRTRELFSYSLGFDEVYNYSFYGEKEIKNCLLKEEGHLKLLNYLSEDQTHLRISLIPNILRNLRLNIKYFDNINIYEIGRTYKEIGRYMPVEEKFIGGAILKKGRNTDIFYEAKGAVEKFFERFNLQNIEEVKGIKNTPYAHPSKSISFIDGHGQTIAKVFILHPTVKNNHELEKYSIAVFELNFTEALKLEQPIKKYKKLSKFPGLDIDISVVIDRARKIKEIRETILETDNNLIQEVTLFDIYEGENIPPDKKAVAFKVMLMAQDRTMTDEEMAEIQQKIFKNLEKLGGKIRGK
ncbi:phenylalanine--tRNA ligase subunit beta [Candidatus Peregrinibacteria bacterium]|nr:phenylalanine--tRNA ligase subunit beta [Candidatus Peregrinibacteria bacterium]